MNTAFMLMTFTGQLTGTAAGNELYERGGWIASGSLSVALVGLNFVFCAVRGPWEEGWYGWTAGWRIRKKISGEEQEQKAEQTSASVDKEKTADDGNTDTGPEEHVQEKRVRKDVC